MEEQEAEREQGDDRRRRAGRPATRQRTAWRMPAPRCTVQRRGRRVFGLVVRRYLAKPRRESRRRVSSMPARVQMRRQGCYGPVR